MSMKIDLNTAFSLEFTFRETLKTADAWHLCRIDPDVTQDGYPYKTHIERLKINRLRGEYPVELIPGAVYRAQVRLSENSWQYQTEYQYQLVSAPELIMPADTASMIRLLTRCDGIGSATAKRLVESYGLDVLQTIADDPAVLSELNLKEKVRDSLVDFCQDATHVAAVRTYCDRLGIPAQYREELMYQTRQLAHDITSLYQVCYGILPWDIIEEIAEKSGLPETDFHRLDYVCMEAVRREIGSSSCMPAQCLGPAVDRLIYDGHHFKNITYTDQQIIEAVQRHHRICTDIPDLPTIYPQALYQYEHDAALDTTFLLAQPYAITKKNLPADHPALAGLYEEQAEAVRMALSHSLSVITGGPGTGKTFTTNRIIQAALSINPELKIVLMAPTARAAQHLTEVTGYDAKTLDSALKLQRNERWNKDTKNNSVTFTDSLVIVDEMSMCDITRYQALVHACGKNSTLVLIGDRAQLPAIGYGDVLGTLTQMPDLIPQVDFVHIHRQAGGSSIPEIAQTIRLGTDDEIRNIKFGGDCIMTECAERDIMDHVLQSYKTLRSQGVSMDDIMILTPVHDGLSGRHMINEEIQQLENPAHKGDKYMTNSNGETFHVGDRVMNLKNHKDIANGNIGTVKELTKSTLLAEFPTGTRRYTAASLDDLTLAYAMTVHKSQGSEADYVIMPVSSDSRQAHMYANSLLYTGLTRGKRHVEIIGSKETFMQGCCRRSGSGRTTLFGVWIEQRLQAVSDRIQRRLTEQENA